jgi:hypothetical protein
VKSREKHVPEVNQAQRRKGQRANRIGLRIVVMPDGPVASWKEGS